MMHYVVLTTGSCGNCFVFYNGHDTLIIDAGVTFTKLSTSLEQHEIPLESIRALLLTHLHPDHSKGAGVIQRRLGVPVYISDISRECNESLLVKQKIEKELLRTFSFGEMISIPGFEIIPFATSHDSDGSSGYAFTSCGKGYFLMTDTGIIPDEAWPLAKEADVKFIESNYDEDMLMNGSYPQFLKKRISGRYGHLENKMAVGFARETSKIGDSVSFVHLSANNNAPEIVSEAVSRLIPSGIFCKVCCRGELFEGFVDEER